MTLEQHPGLLLLFSLLTWTIFFTVNTELIIKMRFLILQGLALYFDLFDSYESIYMVR